MANEVKPYTFQQFYSDLAAIAGRQETVYNTLGSNPTYFREGGWKRVVAVQPVFDGQVVKQVQVTTTDNFTENNKPLLEAIVAILSKKTEVIQPQTQ